MENNLLKRNQSRKRRNYHVKNSLKSRFRLRVSKSNKHISAQLIDREQRRTLASIGTFSKKFTGAQKKKSKESAAVVGEEIAKIALEKQIKEVAFDRGRFKYHGLIAILADAARKTGLKF